MKKEFAICSSFESLHWPNFHTKECDVIRTESACPTGNGLCTWDTRTRTCSVADDPCASATDAVRCGFLDICEFKQKCVDACSSCDVCIDHFSGLHGADETLSITELQSVCPASRRIVGHCVCRFRHSWRCVRRTTMICTGALLPAGALRQAEGNGHSAQEPFVLLWMLVEKAVAIQRRKLASVVVQHRAGPKKFP